MIGMASRTTETAATARGATKATDVRHLQPCAQFPAFAHHAAVAAEHVDVPTFVQYGDVPLTGDRAPADEE